MTPLKILLVEDCNVAQKIGRYILEDMGIQVSSAYNGALALKLSCEYRYDLILMDVGLGDIPGSKATKRIRKSSLNRSTPIVALTAHQDQEMRDHCFDCGMDGYIVKPLTKEIFQETLQLLIRDGKLKR